MGFRDESEAARARLESLERALEETRRTLDAVRAELDAERASHGNAPSALAAQRSEIEALKARLELKTRFAKTEREPLPPKLGSGRVVMVLFAAVMVGGALAGLRVAGNERVASRLRAVATCVEQMPRERAVDLCPDESDESRLPPQGASTWVSAPRSGP